VKDEPNLEDEFKKEESFGAPIPEDAEKLLDSSAPRGSGNVSSFEIEGMRIETIGNYSKCPKCKKNIKSTFIIRHIKLHDIPVEKYDCPEKNCRLQVNRINNLFRHLKVVHKSRKPYLCKHCMVRFAKADQLREHFAEHRSERRKQEIVNEEKEDG
jgi:ribosomal protein S15P/S13E